MKPYNTDQNQGEGDRRSARLYNQDVRSYVADGKVEDAAREAKEYVERDPLDAARAESRARRGPKRGTSATVDELIAKSVTFIDRLRPYVERLTARFRRALHRG